MCGQSIHYCDQANQLKQMRSLGRYDSITFPSYGHGCRLLEAGKLRVQGAGSIKVKSHRPVKGESKTVTIKREVDYWWVCFSVERDTVALAEWSEHIGIDVGVECVCGAGVPQTLAHRGQECPACGRSAARHVLSAQVTLQRARIGRSRLNAEDVVSCLPREAVAFQATE